MIESEGLLPDEWIHLRQMADTLGAVFWLADANKPHILYVSPTYEQIWGRDRQPLYTYYPNFLETIHPDDRQRVEAASSRCVAQGQFELEYRILHPDGEVRWIRDRGFLIRDQNGAPDRIAGYAEDVTQWHVALSNRQQIEQALRESEAKYRSLFTSINTGFCLLEVLFDADETAYNYRFLEVNTAFEAQSGLFNAVGKTILELVPNLEPQWAEQYGQVAKSGNPLRFEADVLSMNRVFDIHAFPSGTLGQNVVAVLFTDISNRKRREQNQMILTKISGGLARLENIEETMEQLGAIIGRHFGVKYCMFAEHTDDFETAIAAYGWNDTDVPSIKGTYRMRDFLAEVELAALLTGDPLIISDTQTDVRVSAQSYGALNIHSFIVVPLLRNHEWRFHISIADNQPRTWQNDEVELMCELTTRIWTRLERARAEEAAVADLRNTQLLRDLGARMVPEGDIQTLYQEIISTAIALTHANGGTVQILDDATQDLVLLAAQGFEPTMTGHFYRVNASSNTPCGIALRNGERTFIDFDVPEREDPDGSLKMHVEAGYLSAQSTPLISRSGRAIGMVSTHWREHYRSSDRELRFLDLLARQAADLIEQRQTEAEREQILAREQAARAEADRANRIKDEFLAVLSHELRSPLNPILGWAKLLKAGKLNPTKTVQALDTIERNALLQSELIEDLLDVSRILRGKLSLNISSVNLVTVIQSAMETVRLAAQAKSITLKADLSSDVGAVSGDATRLQQVVWNLLSNAVKFTPTGGHVAVELKSVNHYAQIIVADTGRGIVPEFLPHVFDYFQQEDGATTRKFGGLGLGLAIVRQIVELHGGTVWVVSHGEGQGATFTVQLPLIPTQPLSDPEPESSSSSLDLNGLQVLVVDDETDSRDFTAFVVEQAGASVKTVASGAEAIAVLMKSPIDVLLSDIGMPEMDGYMLMQQIRGFSPEQNGQVSAIALTAYAGDFNQQQALQAGFQRHIAKPIEPDILVEAIAQLTNGAKEKSRE